ncbi:unnamed protein product [Ostreobium quekettii]|uniref:Uncharacterized protein n=1 Tax=Ostreobium quekettii TaxID=121088 RepID=A0A8S1IL52_9CHLO|nr:unnamed protein product [Ostreobium quekettii]|eukprot:evm.model.scf_58.3 EVM.evm.TU.scf_58.3   scf_58:16137-19693(-)
MLLNYVADTRIYGTHGAHGSCKEAIDAVLAHHFTPVLPDLLRSDDALVPLCLKVVSSVLEARPSFVVQLQDVGVLAKLFDFLSAEHVCNNSHSIRLCRNLVTHTTELPEFLRQLDVADKAHSVFSWAYSKAQTQFFEPLVDLLTVVTQRDAADIKGGVPGAGLSDVFIHDLDALLDLCEYEVEAVAVNASACVLTLARSFPRQCADTCLKGKIETLQLFAHLFSASRVPHRVTHNLLLALTHFASLRPNPRAAPSPDIRRLADCVSRLEAGGDAEIGNLASSVESMLTEVMQ